MIKDAWNFFLLSHLLFILEHKYTMVDPRHYEQRRYQATWNAGPRILDIHNERVRQFAKGQRVHIGVLSAV